RIGLDHAEPPWIVLGNLAQRSNRAPVAFDRDHVRAFGKQRTRQPARSGPDLQYRDTVERSGGPRDTPGEIEVEQEILAERFAGGKFVASDDLAQRREGIDRPHFAAANAGAVTSRAASLRAATRLVELARPVPAISNAVP